MLQSLHVKNLALIDEVEVEFGNGLNILTGETGAGKSIILGSVNLALGGRYSAELLRKGAEFGYVELVFQVQDEKEIAALKELDVFPEEGLIVLNRKLMEGRSVSKINGETVTQGMLKNVASILIDIHGQHEHQTLLNKKNHLMILDEYLGVEAHTLKQEFQTSFRAYKSKVNELDEADLDVESRRRELSFLQFELEEIQEAHLVQGEDEELEAKYRKMINGKKIVEGLEETYTCTGAYGDYTASNYLSHALHALQGIISYDEVCADFHNQLSEIDSLLNDFNREIAVYRDDMEFSEEEFHEVEERLNSWNRLKGKYGKTYEDICVYMEELEVKIQKLEDYDHYLGMLKNEIETLEETMNSAALKLSEVRTKTAKKFSEEVRRGLEELNFLEAQFDTKIDKLGKVTVDGIDNIGFVVSLNPGEEMKPLSNVVSGGELSRIMLTIKTVMADKDQIDTLIFDEVDAGISGITATKVGEKLAVIGKSRQVICITHLAQIAALADTHFIIQKTVENGKTKTGITQLNEKQTIEELTRILGGGQVTAAIQESARQMKELASKIK
ncbi:MAG: DNA repair protein RecN [Eubacteriales bacterium]